MVLGDLIMANGDRFVDGNGNTGLKLKGQLEWARLEMI